MLPTRNDRALEDNAPDARAQLKFVWLPLVDDAIKVAPVPAAEGAIALDHGSTG